jgi:hypothetical protein
VSNMNCASGFIDPDLLPADATGGTALRYTGGFFIFNWNVPKAAGKCYQVVVVTPDGVAQMSDPSTYPPTAEWAYFRAK